LAPPLQIGRYVLHDEIASGGMASVHYGRLVGAGGFAKTVAIKRLHRSLAGTESFRKMILAEGRLAARVRHPNVVSPLDVLAESGELLLVMEYVHGESLARLMRAARAADERVPLPIGVMIVANVLHGLHAAHDAHDEAGNPLDIVHRDVSPQNVIVGIDGVARVIDFGIAKAVTSEGVTSAGTIKGKVPYLSPEQLDGEPATRRTDIYAAAVVLWEVLAGRRLFGGSDDATVLRRIMTMEVERPSAFNPLVAHTVDDVVLKGLARDPHERFASARDMALALEAAVHLATATVVGAWTERLAAETLAVRAKRIREIEREALLGEGPAPPGMPPPGESDTAITQVRPSGRPMPPPSHPPPPQAAQPRSRPPPPLVRPRASSSPPPPTQGTPRISLPPPPAPAMASTWPLATQPAPRAHAQPGPQSQPSSERASTRPVRPPVASRHVIEPRTVIYEPPPLPAPEFVEGVRPIVRDGPAPAPAPARPPSTRPVPAPPAAGVLRKPELAIRNVDWLTPREYTPPRGSAFNRFLRYLAAFFVLTFMTGWVFAPALVRAWVITGAAARGVVVTIESVDVSRRSVRLSGVHAESADLPGATMRAGTIFIGLSWLVPENITIDDAEVSLDLPYSTLSTRVDRYRARHGASITHVLAGIHMIEVTSGRIDWKNLIGSGTSARLENVTLDVTKNSIRALGDDYHLSAPLFTMVLAGAPAGPWQLDVDRQGILVRSVLRFDPSGTYPASVTRTAGDDGSVSVALSVPPTALADLHVPAAVFNGVATARTRIEAHGDVNVVAVQQKAATASRSVSGHIILAAGSHDVFPSGPLVDQSLDLPFVGDTARPIAVNGVLAVAPADPKSGGSAAVTSAIVTGNLDLSGVATAMDLAGTTGPLPCVNAAGTNGLRARIGGKLDDLPGAQVHFVALSACMPKLR
jgi:serine/threonine-protein kinase